MIVEFALAVLFAAGARAEEPVNNSKSPAQEIAAAVRHTAPKGWKRSAYANGADPVVRYSSDSDELVIKLYGGAGSAQADPKDFLSLGETPAKAGSAEVAGQERDVWSRTFPLEPRDPHGKAPQTSLRGAETFVLLPLKAERFAVLSWRRSSPVPDLNRKGEKAWAAFLRSVKASPGKPAKK